jgi:hypothetical protein
MTAKNTTPKQRIELGSIPEPMSGCWLWEGRTFVDGYGSLKWGGKRRNFYAHRFSWEAHKGAIPDNLCMLHECDNPACVHPEHLFLGDRLANNRDRDAKGRKVQVRGSGHGMAKLTEDQARTIQASKLSGPELTRLYGISKAQVSAIRTGKAWTHLIGDDNEAIRSISFEFSKI